MRDHRLRLPLPRVNSRTPARPSRFSGVVLAAFLVTVLVTSSCRKPPGPFTDAIIQEYIAMANLPEEAMRDPYIIGKAVVINAGASLSHRHRTAFTEDPVFRIRSQALSHIHEKIDGRLRAASPSEVGTVVLLRWEKNVVRRNIAGIEIVQVRCHVIVVDATTRRIVGQERLSGGVPSGTHRWGSSPDDAIIGYINRLTRRTRSTEGQPGPQPAFPGQASVGSAAKPGQPKHYTVTATVTDQNGAPLAATIVYAIPCFKGQECFVPLGFDSEQRIVPDAVHAATDNAGRVGITLGPEFLQRHQAAENYSLVIWVNGESRKLSPNKEAIEMGLGILFGLDVFTDKRRTVDLGTFYVDPGPRRR
ncbi:MAG TPA: hypothetical protein VMR52_12345 [Dehalococcoidia bacterium]|nr:hypothetical protein [Dehalococcoidia bacterium]